MGIWSKLQKIIKHSNEKNENARIDTLSEAEKAEDNILENSKKWLSDDSDRRNRVSSLTQRERDTYLLLVEGYTLKEIASQLGIKYSTVNTHMTALYKKLGVNTRAELIVKYRGIV